MKTERSNDFISVNLPLPFVHGLLALAHLMDSRVTESLRSALEENQRFAAVSKPETPSLTTGQKRVRTAVQKSATVAAG